VIALTVVAGIAVGFLFAHILRVVCKAIASAGTDTWGYYFSGAVFALSLAVHPVLIYRCARGASKPILGVQPEPFYLSVFLLLALLLMLCSVVAMQLRVAHQSSNIMAAIAVVSVLIGLGLAFLVAGGYDSFQALVAVGFTLAILPINFALGKLHSQYEPDY
jgi:hypothetical protein